MKRYIKSSFDLIKLYHVQTGSGGGQRDFESRWNAEKYAKQLQKEYDFDDGYVEISPFYVDRDEYILIDLSD